VCTTAGGGQCGGEARHEPSTGDPVEVVLERFEFLPEGICVVERDLNGAVVDFAEGILFCGSSAECKFVGFADVVAGGWCGVETTGESGC